MEQVELARQECKDPVVLIEQRLDYSAYVPEGFGTGDLLIVADHILIVIDFKYGKGVAVDAVWNPQMQMEKWDACAFPVDERELLGRECYGGLDLSSSMTRGGFCPFRMAGFMLYWTRKKGASEV